MNMLLHGVKDTEFEIYHGDTLTNDSDILRETPRTRERS
ncbi:MAG TPA: N-6 DNA methylase [Opitutaceae bacterium]|nr:N-6 DNA methylase [Opitutaceae bacterium]